MSVPPYLSSDEVTLHLVATGVLRLYRRIEAGKPITLPYPAPLQRGMDRLAALCLKQRVPLPQGVPDLLEWCRQPLLHWPLQLASGSVGAGECLIEAGVPTELCDTWACAAGDVEAEITEQALMLAALRLCRDRGAPDAYVAFRRLLIERPVLTAVEFLQVTGEPHFQCLEGLLREAYPAASIACEEHDRYRCCGRCGGLLQVRPQGEPFCEDERCRRSGRVLPGREIAAREAPVWLRRGLRRFVAAPGRSELRLEQRLRALGLDVTLWPEFDAYDLRIVFPDGEVWAVDVKDWANPVDLARRVNQAGDNAVPQFPAWNRAWLVFPDERRRFRRDYLRAFQNQCTVSPASLTPEFESTFVRRVRQKLGGTAGA